MHSAITQRPCPLSTAVHAVHQEKVRIGIFDNVWGKIARSVYEFISNPTVLYFFFCRRALSLSVRSQGRA